MNRPAAVSSLVPIALDAFIAGRAAGSSSRSTHRSSKRVLYYLDPMRQAYKSAKPDTAPDCGMALEPVDEGDAFARTPQLTAGAMAIFSHRHAADSPSGRQDD